MFDEMKICTGFMKSMVSKIISGALKRKTDCNVTVQLNDLNAKVKDGKAHVHLDIDAEMNQEELMKLITIIGLK